MSVAPSAQTRKPSAAFPSQQAQFSESRRLIAATGVYSGPPFRLSRYGEGGEVLYTLMLGGIARSARGINTNVLATKSDQSS